VIVHLAVENELGVFTISMLKDALFGGIRLDANGEPLSTDADTPNFWLEGLMTIKFRLSGSDEVVSLASRQPVLQVGRATSWPPYRTTMRDVSGPNEYYRIDDPAGNPVLLLWSGSITITDRPSPFLAADIVVKSFEYRTTDLEDVSGVTIRWTDRRNEIALIDHYHVFRRRFDLHESTDWQRVGGCISADSYFDPDFDGSASTTYKVRQVFVDPLGDEIHGCGRETEFTVPALPTNRGQLRASGFWR
jgi:hypothetical protein